MPWSCQRLGFVSDILTCAKALSAAVMPISAVLVGDSIWPELEAHFARLSVFGHNYPYSSHSVAAAVAVETIRIYDEMDAPARYRSSANTSSPVCGGTSRGIPLSARSAGAGCWSPSRSRPTRSADFPSPRARAPTPTLPRPHSPKA